MRLARKFLRKKLAFSILVRFRFIAAVVARIAVALRNTFSLARVFWHKILLFEAVSSAVARQFFRTSFVAALGEFRAAGRGIAILARGPIPFKRARQKHIRSERLAVAPLEPRADEHPREICRFSLVRRFILFAAAAPVVSVFII